MMYECVYIVHISGEFLNFLGKNRRRIMRREREPDSTMTNIHQNQIFFKNKYQSLKDVC